MDRRTVFPGQIPVERDVLDTNKHAYVALCKLIEAVFGTSTLLHGFACTPTAPASLQVNVGAGQVFSLQNVDATPYGVIDADIIHQVVKQGLTLDGALLTATAPGTTGQSINYLVQIAFSEADADFALRTYYNASDPTQPFMGANNSGAQDPTRRSDQALISLKAGVAATTGSQVTPAPDAGYIGAFVVTVAYGQTTIVSGNISTYPGAPFITETLTQKLSQATADARYLSQAGGAVTGPITLPGNPTLANHAANKAYVDGLASGIQIKASVRVATTGNGTLAIAYANGQTVDGVVLATGDRILLKDQTAQADNGVYTVNASGAPTRATDMDAWSEVPGALVLVTAGTANAGSSWICSSAAGGTLNTTAIVFQQFANAGSYQAANAFLSGLAALATNGVVVRKADGSAVTRQITGANGIAITNPTGDGGNIQIAPDYAAAADFKAAAANKPLSADQVFSAAQTVNIGDAATLIFDMSTMINAKTTLGSTGGATRAIGAPANVKDGQHGKWELVQDAAGNRGVTWHANWLWVGGVRPTLSTGANARDVLFFCGLSDGKVLASLNRDVRAS